MRREIVEYLAQVKAEGRSEKTLKAYTDRLDALGVFLQFPHIANVKSADLERYMVSLKRSGLKRSSRRSFVSCIRCFFTWLAERGKVLRNPATTLAVEHADEEELPPPPLSIEEVASILDHLPRRNVIDLRNRALLDLLYGCGLRLSEAIAVDLKHLDMPSRVLHVQAGKGGKERDLPIGRGALNALRDYFALRRSLLKGPDNGAVFLDRLGRRIKDHHVWHFLKRLGKSRGIHIHPHLFRHSIAVHLLQNGTDIRYVQQFLGHEKLDTTKIYLRLVPGRLKEDYEKAMPDIAVEFLSESV